MQIYGRLFVERCLYREGGSKSSCTCQDNKHRYYTACLYNGNVRDLNIKTESFPSNFVANMFGFKKMEFFELEEGSAAKEPVAVKF